LNYFAKRERRRKQREGASQIEGLQLAIGGMLDKATAKTTADYLKELRE